jgi:hypothetical protein
VSYERLARYHAGGDSAIRCWNTLHRDPPDRLIDAAGAFIDKNWSIP